MDIHKFIEEQVELLNNDFSSDKIQKNVYKLFFKEYMPDIPLNTVIIQCMTVYAQIIKIYSEQIKISCATCKYLNKDNNYCPIICKFNDVEFGCVNYKSIN